MSSERNKRASENHLKLKYVAETVIFCGRQGLAFRGHRDDTPSVNADPHANHGNFRALLNFRAEAGDLVLKEHLEKAAGNALYISKTIQNEMIEICGDIICGDIIRSKLIKMV